MASSFAAGRKRLYKKMTRDIPQKAKAAAAVAVVAGAERVATLQRQIVAVEDGDLRDSIHVTKPGETTPPYSQPGGETTAREGQAIITAGNTDVRYPHLVEYGTAPHIAGGYYAGARHPGTKRQPFFFPPWRALRTVVKGGITRAISKAVKDGAK